MAELLEADLRDRARSLFDIGNCYLAHDDGTKHGDLGLLMYVPDGVCRNWDTLTEIDMSHVWLSPNNFETSSTRGKANIEVFLDEFGHLSGVVFQNFMGLVIRVADLTEDMMETLAALCDYPVLDETKLSEMENEARRKSWGCWVRKSFERLIERDLKGSGELIESVEISSDEADEESWFKFFCDRLSSTGGEWIEESDSWSAYGLEEAAKTVTLLELNELGVDVQINLWEA